MTTTVTKRMAFIFTSSREEMMQKIAKKEMPDTPLRGLNHLKEGADYFTIPAKSFSSLFFVPRLLRYEFIFAQDNLFLGFIVSCIAKLFRLRTKWIYQSINSSILIRRNSNKWLRLFLLKLFWKSYARIVCISQEQIRDFMRLGIKQSRLFFAPYPIDAKFYEPEEIAPQGEILLSVGRDAGRDYETLFRAAENISHPWFVATWRKSVPEGTVTPKNVSVLYDKDSPQVRELFRKTRILVVVSKDPKIPDGSDCSGQTVILEAFAAGLPVIATERAWMHDYFTQGKDLIIVEPNNPQAIVQAVNELWNDAEKRKKLAKAGHDKVHALYTTKKMAENLEELMSTLS